MTELPDLPPPPERDRPMPHDGLERAITVGRRRRHRYVGGAAGGTLAVVAISALLLSGGPTTDALIANNPEPTPTATATPTGEPSDAPTTAPADDPSAAPSGDASAQPGAASPVQQTGGPRQSGQPDTGRSDAPSAPDDRDPFVEEPRDTSAPLQCAAPPPANAGPVFTGGASACGYASGGGEVRQGGQARVDLGSCQSRNAGDTAFSYAGGQEHEVIVTRGGVTVWRFSETVRYTQGAHERTIRDGRCLEWTGIWPTEYTDGTPAPPGRYQMTVVTTIARADGRALDSESQSSASATVDVVAD